MQDKRMQDKRMQKANEFLTNLLSKFSKIEGSLDTIDSVKNMENELKKDDELLRRDVNNTVSSLTSYIPYLLPTFKWQNHSR